MSATGLYPNAFGAPGWLEYQYTPRITMGEVNQKY